MKKAEKKEYNEPPDNDGWKKLMIKKTQNE
jgi:hypothetical protein